MSKILDVMTAPWAITTNMLQEIGGIYLTHLRGEKIDIAGVEARLGHPLNNDKSEVSVVDNVAVIDVHGVIAKRANLFMQISGGVSTELLGNDIQTALDDPAVEAIILDVDSPGGTVDGTFELADAIYAARGDKPVVALANGLMASAAYAIGAACDAIYMTGVATHVGSIGVVTSHTDYSKYEEKNGIKTTEIYAGKYKRIASQHEPLSDEGKAAVQESVDYLYSLFVNRVATFRGVAVSAVLDDMADGRLFIGQQAIDAGLVDGVSTLENMIAELSAGHGPASLKTISANSAQKVIQHNPNEEKAMSTIKISEINAAYIAAEHPEVAAQLRQDGLAEAVAEATGNGATAERERIQSVFAQSMPGHTALIQTLAFDGKTTGPEAAVQVLSAERNNKSKAGADLAADAAALDVVDATVDATTGADEETAHMTTEERCKAKWDKSADIRAEFGEFATFMAYEKGMEKGGKVLGKTKAA